MVDSYEGPKIFFSDQNLQMDEEKTPKVVYDEVLKKYMTTQDRGIIKPKKDPESGKTISINKSTTYLEGTNGVFLTTDTFPKLLQKTKPLLDRSNTPREAFRLTSLDRNYTNKRWLYNKNTCDDFNPGASKRDV